MQLLPDESIVGIAPAHTLRPRDVLLANEGIYRELHGNEDGSIPATFRMIYMIGWKEGPNQAQPLARP